MTATQENGPVSRFLPHRDPLILLDDVVVTTEEEARTRARIDADHPFMTAQGVAGHVLIELMAQTCGVFVGAQSMAQGHPIQPGFLLGSRNFQTRSAWIKIGTVLDIHATLVFRDEAMAVFDCAVECGGERIAEARLNVYQPPDGQNIRAETEPS